MATPVGYQSQPADCETLWGCPIALPKQYTGIAERAWVSRADVGASKRGKKAPYGLEVRRVSPCSHRCTRIGYP